MTTFYFPAIEAEMDCVEMREGCVGQQDRKKIPDVLDH
jgi:hypothetical protein